MATKKSTADLSGLVATKGSAAPVANMPTRTPAHAETEDAANNVPLNFRVSGEFRRRFRMYAAAHDLKLNELLRLAFDEYEQRHKS
ncbi:ribbon-helix-helix protein [Brucella pseudintermedia]|uniref:ribbon-helix-helix protein n=1 Tax=Brucella pseudintermedia TaxID=370111 RepID=UPI0030F3BD9E